MTDSASHPAAPPSSTDGPATPKGARPVPGDRSERALTPSVRPMTQLDLEAVQRVETRAYAFPWSRRNFHDCLIAGHLCLVAELDGLVIGHGIATVAVGEAHLLNLCVSRDRQGAGYGRVLLEAVLTGIFERGGRRVFLEVRPTNFSAVTLYESRGFVEIGVRKDYYPAPIGYEDARVLALDLS